jgi:hypothetical protein
MALRSSLSVSRIQPLTGIVINEMPQNSQQQRV